MKNGVIVATGDDGNPLNDGLVSIDIHESTYILNIFTSEFGNCNCIGQGCNQLLGGDIFHSSEFIVVPPRTTLVPVNNLPAFNYLVQLFHQYQHLKSLPSNVCGEGSLYYLLLICRDLIDSFALLVLFLYLYLCYLGSSVFNTFLYNDFLRFIILFYFPFLIKLHKYAQ